MFIPNYQIHNILKDFTQQLKKDNKRQEAGHRLEMVVNKVAGTIVDRVARLSEEEVRDRATTPRIPSQSSPRAGSKPSGDFYYHTMGKDAQKVKRCLSVENPELLINRFQAVLDKDDRNPSEE